MRRETLTEQETLDFAKRFIGAIQSGDVATVRACYAPDAKIWHNNDRKEQTVDQNVKVLPKTGEAAPGGMPEEQ